MTYLLDVNVLIALMDPNHVAHDTAHAWFDSGGSSDWSSCPITQNGVIRILGHPRYPGGPGAPAAVGGMVRALCRLPGHSFWADDISLVDNAGVDVDEVTTPAQVTDTYLLALAKSKGGLLATLDRRLSVRAIRGGRSAVHLVS